MFSTQVTMDFGFNLYQYHEWMDPRDYFMAQVTMGLVSVCIDTMSLLKQYTKTSYATYRHTKNKKIVKKNMIEIYYYWVLSLRDLKFVKEQKASSISGFTPSNHVFMSQVTTTTVPPLLHRPITPYQHCLVVQDHQRCSWYGWCPKVTETSWCYK
jgi:hypothetical protein